MSRPLRLEYPGAWYHVMNRGLDRQPAFLDSACYQSFLDILQDAHERFDLEIHAYCLMSNHYHLLVRTPYANLGRAMRHINGVYTQRFNRLQKRDGPLFRGRYKAILIDADSYLLSVSRYIHRNPIDTRKPLVDDLSEYGWSSYPAYIDKAPASDWLYREATYAALGQRNRYRGYQAFVAQTVEEELQDYYHSERQTPVLGDDTFRRQLSASLNDASGEVPGWERQSGKRPTAQDVIDAVAEAYGTTRAELCARPAMGRRAWSPERALAMWLCQNKAGLTLPEIAHLFGGVHYSAVSQAIRRLKSRLAEEGDSGKIKSIMSRFDPYEYL